MKRTPLLSIVILTILALSLFVSASSLAQSSGDEQNALAEEEVPAVSVSGVYTLHTTQAPTGDAPQRPRFVDGLYIVTLVEPPLSSYRGGIADLAPTHPGTRGELKLDTTSGAFTAYRNFLEERQQDVLNQAEQLLGHPLEVLYTYDVVTNGLSVKLAPEEAAKMRTLAGVKRVRQDEWHYPTTDVTPAFTGATTIWDGSNSAGGVATKGDGIIVGVIDTGIWPEHSSFADDGSYPAPTGWNGACDQPADGTQGYTCTNKLIGIRFFLNGYIGSGTYDGLFNSGRDDNGHGTHTASTAAGNENVPVTLLGVTRNPISGMAPRAYVASYKALGPKGGTSSDLEAAINKAVEDGVDVINYSIGGASSDPWQDTDALAFLNARDAGVFVATSAGNSGPGASTVGSPGDAPWITTIGASTSNRHFISDITLSGPGTPPTGLFGASVTAGVTNFNLVDAEGIADSEGDASGLCLHSYNPGTFHANDVVLCKRGQIARVARGDYVQAGGGGGVILYNPVLQGLATDNYVIPAVHVEYDIGQLIKDYIDLHPAYGDVTVSFTQGSETDDNDPRVTSDMMAEFSSRGPSGPVPSVIKPNVTAPGVQILAGNSPENVEPGKQGELFMAIQGTSMSSPHVAGAGALVKAVQPSWTPNEVESALMTTANSNHVKEDGVNPADPFDMGTGRIDLTKATRAGLVLNETKTNFDAANPATGGDPTTLNIASMGNGSCYQTCSWTRTVRNPTTTSMAWDGVFEGIDGLAGTLSPTSFSLAGGASTTFSLTIDDVTGLTPGQWYFGTVTWTEQGGLAPDARFPVAVRVADTTNRNIVVKSADVTGVGVNGVVQYDITIKNTKKTQRSFSLSDSVPTHSSYVNGSATGGLIYNGGANALSWSGDLAAAEFVIEERDLGGYVSMAGLGISPFDKPAGSEDSGCFQIGGMDFYYLDQHYDTVVWGVNGVIRAGAPLIGFCPPATNTSMPTPSRRGIQDNYIAGWWTDLDLTTSGNWYAVGLNRNGAPHTVFEWENVPVKGTSYTATFQIWIEDGTDNIWFSYPSGGPINGAEPSPTATVGAENEDGSEGVEYYYNGTGTVPDGSTDIWVGLDPTVKTLGFQVTATGSDGDNILNEADVTVASNTDTAWANTHICSAAAAAPANALIVGPKENYAGLDWSNGASIYNTYEVWRSADPYFTPGDAGTTKVYSGKAFSYNDNSSGPNVGDPDTNNYYVLRTVNCVGTSTADAAPVAEFDFALTPGDG